MADFSTLIASIEATIKQNGVQAITGQVLQDELLLMVSAINQLKQDTLEGYAFYGEALPNGATRVVTQNTFFLAGAGSYTINGNAITISDSGISVIVYDCVNDEITTYQLFAYDANPTSGSGNAVTSGGVKSALDAKADKNGASPDLFAGFAGNLVDTRSAGTRQSFAFRQSGGDGVNYMRKILGRTEAWNQGIVDNIVLGSGVGEWNSFDASTTLTVSDNIMTMTKTGGYGIVRYYLGLGKITAGHKYYLAATIKTDAPAASVQVNAYGVDTVIDDTYRSNIASSDWQRLRAIRGCSTPGSQEFRITNTEGSDYHDVQIKQSFFIDLTLMFGAGNEPATVAAFEALHPLPYYNYNAGVLKNNAATGIKTRGFNQWDEEWEIGAVRGANGANDDSISNTIRSKNYMPVFPNTVYYARSATALSCRRRFYDANKNYLGENTSIETNTNQTFTTPVGAYYMRFYMVNTYGTVYNHDICINLSDASRNGIYEPYWKREIVMGLNSIPCHDENNNAVVVNGLDGVWTKQDAAYGSNGYLTDIDQKFAEVDLGTLNWVLNESFGFVATPSPGPKSAFSAICEKYPFMGAYTNVVDKTCGYIFNTGILVKDSAYSDAAAFKSAMSGVKLRYERATPKHLTLDNPIPAFVEVDNLGTEERLPADTAADPQAPFECDSNYSISTANLVRKLSE